MIIIKTIRYLFEAFLGLIFLIFTKILGLKLSSAILSLTLSFIGPRLRISNRAKKNLEIAFPEISDEKKAKIISNMWKNLGMVISEFFHLSKISDEKNIRIEVIGEEIAKNYPNKGVIFVSGHFANWEIIPLVLRDYRNEVGGIYRHSNNFFVNRWVVEQRKKILRPFKLEKALQVLGKC